MAAAFRFVARLSVPAVAATLLSAGVVSAAPTTVPDPVVGSIRLFRPAGEPTGVVVLLSGFGGWTPHATEAATRLEAKGALVAGIDTRRLLAGMREAGGCAYPAGPLELLAKRIEQREQLPAYRRPILAGVAEGASLAYAALAAAPPDAFTGGIGLGFSSTLPMRQPLCRIRGLVSLPRAGNHERLAPLALAAPWFSSIDEGWPALMSALRTSDTVAQGPDVAGLKLIEVPSAKQTGDTFVVFLTGDGGWADLDRTVAARLAAANVPVVGWSSLDYYWTRRTPDGAAADLTRVIEHYAARWKRPRVKIIGYSFGADVAPFLVNRLPAATRVRVRSVALFGPASSATFEFHLTDWIRARPDASYPMAPALAALRLPLACVYPADERDSVCMTVDPAARHVVGNGHHFGEEYARLAELVLAAP